ncbi:hypothetical protein, partial [Mesotoga sp. B105.6.4]|uniref:hypothetical protein n=1 Tax=Mesotoga sp. B105.6.4 TaxID=1582224 RepID=UPI000CCF4F7C
RMLPELWRSLNEFYSLFGIKELKFGDYLTRKLESLSNQVDSVEFADPRNQRLVKLTLIKLQNILHYYRESNKRKSVFITRAHGDLQFSNILYKDGRFRFIDFERSEERQVVYDLICLQLQSRFTSSKLYKSFSFKSIDNLVKECLKWSFLGKEYGYQSEAISLAFLLDEFEYWLVDLVNYERENPHFFVWLAKLENN